MQGALSKLTSVGFSSYEARAYLALLKESPMTAYEIAKGSGVPTSKIYEVIRRLENRTIIQSIHSERSKVFVPLAPDEMISNLKTGLENSLSAVSQELRDLGTGTDRSYTWHIRDYEGIIIRAMRMLDTARSTILLSVWPSELDQVLERVMQAAQRGVRIAVVHYGATRLKLKQLYIHPVEDSIYEERGIRGITLVADSREALNGTIGDERAEAVWSMNEGYVTMAEGYVRHDIYQMKTVRRLGPVMKQVFGERFEKMRDVFSDEGQSS